jgi:chromosome segregation ATPase
MNDNSDTGLDLENEKAVLALLAASVQQGLAEAPVAAPEKPVSIDTLNDLHRQKAEVEQKLAEIERKLQAMQNQLKGISEEKADLVRRQQVIQAQATKLCEVLFGIETRPVEQPQLTSPVSAAASSAAPARKLDNSIVNDRSSPIIAMPQGAPAEVDAVQKLGGFAF